MDAESRLRLDRDLPDVHALLAETGGLLVQRPEDPLGTFWATVAPRSGEAPFIARVVWTVYPDQPPSVLFTTSIGGAVDPAGWPEAPGYRRGADICKPITAEGYAVHPEWRTGVHAWRTSGNAFLYVVEVLQEDIDRVSGRRTA